MASLSSRYESLVEKNQRVRDYTFQDKRARCHWVMHLAETGQDVKVALESHWTEIPVDYYKPH